MRQKVIFRGTLISIGAFLLLLVGAGALRLRRAARAEQGVVFEPAFIELGDASQGETITRQVSLRNTLSEPIRIVGLHSTCHCTSLPEKLLGTELSPHTQIEVPLTLSTGSSEGSTSGRATAYYRVAASRQTMAAAVVISSDVQPDYRIEPRIVDFGSVTQDAPVERTITLRPVGLANARIVGARSSHREFSVTPPISGDDNSSNTLSVTFVPPTDSTAQYFNGVVTVDTTSTRAPTAKILVQSHYESPIQVTPSALVFLLTQKGSPAQRVRIHAQESCCLTEVTCNQVDLEISSFASAPSTEHFIEARVGVYPVDRDIHGVLTVRLSSPSGAENAWATAVVVPVHVLVAKGE